ncbi:hypothetical protein [Cryobacterium sp. Y11]|uniref:hypothetical protein n=1 Tax=Cryobacterium sp. Y11 TaxID=2045016 RepID=UPI001304D5DD|nr:hypothetical protein [Cryobacterium sp. Y11]
MSFEIARVVRAQQESASQGCSRRQQIVECDLQVPVIGGFGAEGGAQHGAADELLRKGSGDALRAEGRCVEGVEHLEQERLRGGVALQCNQVDVFQHDDLICRQGPSGLGGSDS